MNIVAIGGTRFIGAACCRELILAGHQITSISRAANNIQKMSISYIDSNSILKIIGMIQTITGAEISIERRDARRVDVTSVSVNSTSANRVLDWQSLTHIDQGLEQTWEWLKKQPR